MSNIKTIQINKDYLALNKKTIKKEKGDKKIKPKTLVTHNKRKKEFLKRIKNFQQERALHVNEKKEEEEFENEFSKSLRFLQEARDAIKITNMEEPKDAIKLTNMEEFNIPEPKDAIKLTNMEEFNIPEPKDAIMLTNMEELNIPEPLYIPKIQILPRPPYSSLKNTGRPTYREWVKLKTKKNPLQVNKQVKKRKKRIIKTMKRILGKGNKSIAVLIKGKKTRRNIQEEKIKLSKTNINEVKKYLRDKNMIKLGNSTPKDIIFKMYEQCVLAGDVTNKSSENLIHNFLNDKK
jgi:hypothetical protein